MNTEIVSQKERFLQEVEQKLLRKELDARLLEDGLIRVKWNGQPLCSVDRDGIVRFRPADITGPEVDRQLRTVIQTAGHVKEYIRSHGISAMETQRQRSRHTAKHSSSPLNRRAKMPNSSVGLRK